MLMDLGIQGIEIEDKIPLTQSDKEQMFVDILPEIGADDGVAYIVLDNETMCKYNVEEGDTEGFVNIPLSIDKVVMSILVKEDKGHARVSIRSKKGTSANTCSKRYFNGGGHENAAGGRLYMPENISDINEAGKYIEVHTHIFMNGK